MELDLATRMIIAALIGIAILVAAPLLWRFILWISGLSEDEDE